MTATAELGLKPEQIEWAKEPDKTIIDQINSQEGMNLFRDQLIKKIDSETQSVGKRGQEKVDIATRSIGLDESSVASILEETKTSEQLENINSEALTINGQARAELSSLSVEDTPAQENVEINEKTKIITRSERLEKSADFLARMPVLTRENTDSYIELFNKSVDPKVLSSLEFTLVQSIDEQILYIDQNGKLNKLEVTKENASDVLREIKKTDEGLKSNSYELRKEIVKRSEGKVLTCEAYTVGDTKGFEKAELKNYLDNPDNWVEDRKALQDEIVDSELQKAAKLSERLGDEEPAIYALRGNTAAGKTTRLKNDPIFSKAIDEKGQPSGAINPDTYKSQLKQSDVVFGKQAITHFQSHVESSMLARKIKKSIAESQGSMIIDQRLNEKKDISDLIEESGESGKKLKFLDVESPLESSLIRVLDRKIGGDDPLPPFGAVVEGYEGVKQNRKDLINKVINEPNITDYVLYCTDKNGNSVKAAEKANGEFQIISGQEDAYKDALDEQTGPEVEKLGSTVIDDNYINETTSRLNLRQSQVDALNKYKGKTFEQALNEHSRKINEEAPSFDKYKSDADKNLLLTSRTAQGEVDTTASVDKASKMDESLTANNAAEKASENFNSALENAYQNKDQQFTSPKELRTYIESIASKINSGITKEGVLIRQGEDSEKYPYVKVAELEESMQQFYQELYDKIKNPHTDPKELAGWVEYRIDLRDHFFADGCGKTAKLVSSWVLMRAEKPLPDYAENGKISPEAVRSEYYKNAPKTTPGQNTDQELREAEEWNNYYKKLF